MNKKARLNSVFNSIQVDRAETSTFDLSHDHKTTFKMGTLNPIYVQECIPGDKFKIGAEALYRLMPMTTPVMHRMKAYIHFFFVPNRLVWSNWEKFISPETTGIVPPVFPTMAIDTGVDPIDVTAGSLANRLGLPITSFNSSNMKMSAIPFAAYRKIWYDYYRDENLQHVDDIKLQDGDQTDLVTHTLETLMVRAWEHDYFTSCLPFAQKGDPVNIPIDFNGNFMVKLDDTSGNNGRMLVTGTGTPPTPNRDLYIQGVTGALADSTLAEFYQYDPNDTLYIDSADVTSAMTSTIQDLRRAESLQKYLEKMAYAGSRYIEYLWAIYDVRSSDARLQRAEYIGGMKTKINISEVLQTGETTVDSPQGNMAGHGVGYNRDFCVDYFCEEFGYIIGICSFMPDTSYYQGIPKHFYKFDPLDYAIPDLAKIGEEPVKNYELFYDSATVTPDQANSTFGYLPRYTDYRYNPSRVSAQFAVPLSMMDWTLVRDFATLPVLDSGFISCDPSRRIFADQTDNDKILAHFNFMIEATRKLPYYGEGAM